MELFQEGSVAAVAAVDEYLCRDAGIAGLAGHVRRMVATHLDLMVERGPRPPGRQPPRSETPSCSRWRS
jgi:hypothetical protein